MIYTHVSVGGTYLWSAYYNWIISFRHISEDRVGVALKTVQPQYHSLRCQATARSLNPVPYKADYFGEKIHIDQNEKLILFGITHIAAIDGYSSKIVGFITMPIKNPIEIYSHGISHIICTLISN